MYLKELPKYKIGAQVIDAEKAFLATALLRHFLVNQIPWEYETQKWTVEELRDFYDRNPTRRREDHDEYIEAAQILTDFILSIVDPQTTQGWEGTDAIQLQKLVSDDPKIIKELTSALKTGLWGDDAKDTVKLGDSAVKISIKQLGKLWPYQKGMPDGQIFTRGDYLRFLWTHLLLRKQN
jgi:hypothetical protein